MRTIMYSLILLLFSLELEAQTVVFANSKDHRDLLLLKVLSRAMSLCADLMERSSFQELLPR